MFLFTTPLYKLLATEIRRICEQTGPESLSGEQAVEIRRGEAEVLLRFTLLRGRRRGRFTLRSCRLLTWYEGRLCSSDFDLEILNRNL